jgi:hypothetical protein
MTREVSLGATTGLRQGHTLDIYRGDKYPAGCEREAKPQAIGLILKEFKQETIRKGDQVATDSGGVGQHVGQAFS